MAAGQCHLPRPGLLLPPPERPSRAAAPGAGHPLLPAPIQGLEVRSFNSQHRVASLWELRQGCQPTAPIFPGIFWNTFSVCVAICRCRWRLCTQGPPWATLHHDSHSPPVAFDSADRRNLGFGDSAQLPAAASSESVLQSPSSLEAALPYSMLFPLSSTWVSRNIIYGYRRVYLFVADLTASSLWHRGS